MNIRVIIFIAILTLFTGQVKANELAEANEEELLQNNIKLQREKDLKQPITLNELDSIEEKRTKPIDPQKVEIIDDVAGSSLISIDIINKDQKFIRNQPYFQTIDPPIFKRNYSLEEIQQPINECTKKLSPKQAYQWEITGYNDKAGVRLFNLKATKSNLPPEEQEELLTRTWDFLKGEKIDNSILLGMFSHHTSPNRHNETHNIIGIDYKGYSIGTFKNSYSDQTYYAGISRKIYEHYLRENLKFDIKYKAIVMHGYADHYPDLAGFTPIIMPIFGLTFGHTGMDFIAIPAKHPTFTVNFRFNLPQKNI